MRSSRSIVIALIAVLLFYLCLSLYRRYDYQRKMRNEGCQPIPKYLHKDPFFGSDYQKIQIEGIKKGQAGATRSNLHAKYGHTYEHYSFGQRAVCTMNIENIRTVLGPSASNFIVSPARRRSCAPLLTDNLVMLDGYEWKQSRDLIMSVISKEQAIDLTSLERHIQKLLKLIPRDGSTVDLQPLFIRLFIDRATEFILGESTNSLNPDEEAHPEAEKFVTLFENVLRVAGHRFRLGQWYFLRGREVQWRKDIATIFASVDGFIDNSIARRSSSSPKATPGFSLVDHYLNETNDKAKVRSQLMSAFLGGRDQIGISISLLMFALARHPEVWLKLRQEVLAQPLSASTTSTSRLLYTRKVVYEGLRLFSPILWSYRYCSTDCILPRGGGKDGQAPILLPKGTEVQLDIYSLHRDRTLWGESADEFIPERWNENDMKPGWKYIPFNAGKRMCPARDLSLTQMIYLLARLVQEFEFLENRDPVLELIDDVRSARMSRNGVQVALIAPQI